MGYTIYSQGTEIFFNSDKARNIDVLYLANKCYDQIKQVSNMFEGHTNDWLKTTEIIYKAQKQMLCQTARLLRSTAVSEFCCYPPTSLRHPHIPILPYTYLSY